MVIKEILVFVIGILGWGWEVGASPISKNCEKLIQSHLGIQLPFNSTQNPAFNSSLITKSQLGVLAQHNCLIQMHPFYKWAQNTTHIHVKIQFRLSAETTPCEHVLYSNRVVKHDSFEVEILCLHTQYYLINYHLYVKTFKSMNYHHLEWSIVPNKYVVLEVMKAPVPYIWKYLHSSETVPKKKPKIWWEMLKKFEEDMGMLANLITKFPQMFDKIPIKKQFILIKSTKISNFIVIKEVRSIWQVGCDSISAKETEESDHKL